MRTKTQRAFELLSQDRPERGELNLPRGVLAEQELLPWPNTSCLQPGSGHGPGGFRVWQNQETSAPFVQDRVSLPSPELDLHRQLGPPKPSFLTLPHGAAVHPPLLATHCFSEFRKSRWIPLIPLVNGCLFLGGAPLKWWFLFETTKRWVP